jgi:uncharacterized membrane protein YcaP (DUF421 family)
MEVVFRSVAIFVMLWLLLRIMGKRELAEMTAFELVLLVVMGDLVQQGATQEDMSFTGAVLAAGTIALLTSVMSLVTWRWRASRPILEGRPVVVVRDGEVYEDALDLEHVTEEELMEAARRNGIADLNDVSWCVLEPDGRFSFLQRNQPGAADRGGGEEEQRPGF